MCDTKFDGTRRHERARRAAEDFVIHLTDFRERFDKTGKVARRPAPDVIDASALSPSLFSSSLEQLLLPGRGLALPSRQLVRESVLEREGLTGVEDVLGHMLAGQRPAFDRRCDATARSDEVGYSSLRHDRGSESSAPFGVRSCRNE
jgi:hypothetical protein